MSRISLAVRVPFDAAHIIARCRVFVIFGLGPGRLLLLPELCVDSTLCTAVLDRPIRSAMYHTLLFSSNNANITIHSASVKSFPFPILTVVEQYQTVRTTLQDNLHIYSLHGHFII